MTYLRDDEWKAIRTTLAPVFTSSKLKKMFDLMKRCTKNVQDSIEKQNGQEIDLKQIFSVFTVDIISTCCFSIDLKDYLHPNSEILVCARKFFNVSRFKMAIAAAIPKTLLAAIGFDINDNLSIEFFGRFGAEIIRKRRELAKQSVHSKKQDDFLQTLIDAATKFSENKNEENKQVTPTTTTTTSSSSNEETVNQQDLNSNDRIESKTDSDQVS